MMNLLPKINSPVSDPDSEPSNIAEFFKTRKFWMPIISIAATFIVSIAEDTFGIKFDEAQVVTFIWGITAAIITGDIGFDWLSLLKSIPLPAPDNDIPTPPTVPMPTESFVGLERDMQPYGDRKDFDDRKVHVPQNMTYAYSHQDHATKIYPAPNVNIDARGAEFAIFAIAGSWGFSQTFVLDKGVEYVVIVDYNADVKSDKQPLGGWLWWELNTDGWFQPSTVPIENGTNKRADWIITGTGNPQSISPRIRAQWASAGKDSRIMWTKFSVIRNIGNQL